ncbi:hypothetical protein KY366_00375 [Candidatus Woesearchaeota archaeon]|nr:hypothetical protein [Candidatus Woesearchaeota archaeon]
MNKGSHRCTNCKNRIDEGFIEIDDSVNKMPFCDWNCVYDYVKNPHNFR